MSSIKILSVGDITTDAFIRLMDEPAHTYSNEDGSWLAIPFGTKLPFESAEIIEAEGNAANAAISFSRLGLSSALVSNVGDDQHGRDMVKALERETVDTRYVHSNAGKRTNYNYILRYKAERTILVHNEHYEYRWPAIHAHDVPVWVYFSSVSKNALPFHDDLADWLHDNHEVKLAFQPGTFQIEEGASRLKKLYKRTEILLLNRQEAALVGDGNEKDVHDLFDKLHALGPKVVVITDGPKGTYASSAEGRFFMPIYPDPGPPVERTGAGDAFSSSFVAAIIKGESLQEALRWAPINSMNVVQHVGAHAGLLTEGQLLRFLKDAPEWYHASPM
jgi:sugar/nucleoside kinase (ribokinase family)